MAEDRKQPRQRSGIDRRAALGLALGAGGALTGCAPAKPAATAAAAPDAKAACVMVRETIRGPYYIDHVSVRRDITENLPGVKVLLRLKLIDVDDCGPLPGAAVDLWHADSGGIYSGFGAADPDSAPVGIVNGSLPRSDDRTFLRGVQITDANGVAEFLTIFPGWYFGRATHVHTRVHIGAAAGQTLEGGRVCHTGQIFFPETLASLVDRIPPYAAHKADRVRIADDFVVQASKGEVPIFSFNGPDHVDAEHPLVAEVTLAVDSRATTNPPKGGPPPPRPAA